MDSSKKFLSESGFLFYFKCTAAKTTRATSTVCYHSILICIKMSAALPTITFANVKKSEKGEKKTLIIVWKEFWLYRPPKRTSEDSCNLQSMLLKISGLLSILWDPYVNRCQANRILDSSTPKVNIYRLAPILQVLFDALAG